MRIRDRVRLSKIGVQSYGPQSSGGAGTVEHVSLTGSYLPGQQFIIRVLWDNGSVYNYHETYLVKESSSSMSIKDKFTLVFKGEPERSFIKAGVMNPDESLTADGQAIFLAWLLKEHGAEFKTEVIDPILAEEDKAAK